MQDIQVGFGKITAKGLRDRRNWVMLQCNSVRREKKAHCGRCFCAYQIQIQIHIQIRIHPCRQVQTSISVRQKRLVLISERTPQLNEDFQDGCLALSWE